MKYLCTVCGYVYDPANGDPDSGIAPGTKFEDIPDSWVCPVCGVGKDSFVPQEYRARKLDCGPVLPRAKPGFCLRAALCESRRNNAPREIHGPGSPEEA